MNAAALLAVDPAGLGGAVLRGGPGPARERWLAAFRAGLPAGAPVVRVPLSVGEDRLHGGLDLAATLAAGRPIMQAGLLAAAAEGVLLLSSAERLAPGTAAAVAAALDIGVSAAVAFDEAAGDEGLAPALLDRLAFRVDPETASVESGDTAAARARLPSVIVSEEVIEGLCAAAAVLGVASLRAALLAVRAARAAAALAGRHEVSADDAAVAAGLVLGPRATALPAPPDPPEAEAPPDPEPEPEQAEDRDQAEGGTMADRVLEAAMAALPAGLLTGLRPPGRVPGRMGTPGKYGARGRPAGTRPGDPRRGLRLDLLETLRAAAPWQRLRGGGDRIAVRASDLRVIRRRPRSETTTIFLVDASGSQALNRLAEAKGAVQLLLAECYVRRDQVAMIAFRGRSAEILLPPTRSLVRAKRQLAGLPGGGGTPLAAGLDAGCALADTVRRRGGAPSIVLLTDGQANVDREGRGGRKGAERDATEAARRLRVAGHAAVLVDTSARPHPLGRRLAGEMGARYLALPYAGAGAIAHALRP